MQLPKCYLFQGLSPSQHEQIAAVTGEITIGKGDWLFQEDQPAEKVFMLLEGAIELLTRVNDEMEIPIAIVRPGGGCFGLGALVDPYLYSLSARCADDSRLLSIASKDLFKLMDADPELGWVLMTNVARRLLDRLKETRQEIKLHFKNLIRNATF